jgi:hypothetical protein
MPARQSAGSMLRSVSYAANIVGGDMHQCPTQQSGHCIAQYSATLPTTLGTTLLTLDVPLASASSFYHTINTVTRILRAFTRQTRMREQQRRFAIHPCWHSLTILTPVIPRPRQGTSRRLGLWHTGLQGVTLKCKTGKVYSGFYRRTNKQNANQIDTNGGSGGL